MARKSRVPVKFPLFLIIIFIALAVGIGITGRLYYEEQKNEIRKEKQDALAAIADLKIRELARWRHERMEDAASLMENPLLAAQVEKWFMQDAGAGFRLEALGWLESIEGHSDYDAVLLADSDGVVRFSVPEGQSIDEDARAAMTEAVRLGKPRLVDFHMIEGVGHAHLGLVVPIPGPSGAGATPNALIVLRIDPHRFLYPVIRSWPMPSRTAESLLVRREGEEVVYLSELRHREAGPLSVRVPASDHRLTAAAEWGSPGVVEGIDYRGVPVLAAIREIEDSPWTLIAKVDKEEIFAPLGEDAGLVGVFAGAWILVAAVVLALIWSRRTARDYRDRYELERERLEVTQRYRYLSRYANDIIILSDRNWNIVEANDRAVASYGYSLEELLSMNLGDLQLGGSREELAAQMNKVAMANGLVYEAVHRRKDGTIFPVEVSSRLVQVGDELVYWATVRDVTERRQAEEKIIYLNRLYALLSQINLAIVREKDMDRLFAEVCRIAVEHGKFSLAWIGLVDREKGMVRPVHSSGEAAGYLTGLRIFLDREPEMYGPTATCVREVRCFVSNDIKHDPVMRPWRDKALAHGFRSSAAIPIQVRGTVIGALNIYSAEPHFFDEEEFKLIEEIGVDLSFALGAMEQERQRKRAEERLRESEDRYRAIFENTGTATVILEDTVILLANRRFEILSGYSREEVEGKINWAEFVAGGDLERMQEYHRLRQIASSLAPEQYEFKFVDRHGNLRDVNVTVGLIPGTGRSVASLIDITERKMTERALKESEEKFSKAFLLTPHIIAVSSEDESRYVEVNETFCKTFGYGHDEVIGKTSFELDIWDDPQDRWRMIQALSDTGSVRNMEIKFRKKSGETFIGLISSDIVTFKGERCLLSVTTDITELRLARDALVMSEKRYRELVQSANSIILRMDTKGRVTFLNEFAQTFYGYSDDEILGKNILDAIVPEKDSLGRDLTLMIRDILRDPDRFPNNEYENIRKNGERVWVAWANKGIYDQDGRLVEILSIGNDITHQKLLEEQYRQAQKMEAIGLLAGGVAHDFNNLLGVIMGYSELCLTTIHKESPLYDNIEHIKNAGLRAATLVRQLLAFSRKQILDPRVMNLNTIISETEKMLRRLIGEDIQLESTLEPDLWPVRIDPSQLEQVILNLAVNARDAMPDGGRLTIRTANVTLDDSFAREQVEAVAGPYVLLEVADNGAGIDKDTLRRIFEPFFTTKEKGRGTGLGLATVYGIIKQSSGHISVRSRPRCGTTFSIYLPRVEEVAEAERYPSAGADAYPRGSETILLVEDEALLKTMIGQTLRRHGYTVLEAADGESALKVTAGHAGPIHLLVTDVVMPGMNGHQLAQKLAASRPETTVLYMTGYADDPTVRRELSDATRAILQKPFTSEVLMQRIRGLLDGTE